MTRSAGISLFMSLVVLAAFSAAGCKTARGSREASGGTVETMGAPREASYSSDTTPSERRDRDAARTASTASATEAGVNVFSMAFPTGREETSAVLLKKIAPREVRAGRSFEYLLEVTNLTELALEDVNVSDQISENLDTRHSDPLWTSEKDGMLTWAIGNLGPGEKKVIRVNAVAVAVGAISACSRVVYNTGICSSIDVVQPNLQLALSGPAEVLACDDIVMQYRVTNSGNGTAENVVVRNFLPENLTTDKGYSSFQLKVGTLQAGESRDLTATLKASEKGEYLNKAVAVADGDLKAESNSVNTVILQPALEISSRGPARAFLGRPITYTIEVKNTGDGLAADTIVESILPANATLARTPQGAKKEGNKVIWDVGSLRPQEGRTASLTLSSMTEGNIQLLARSRAYCASPETASTRTVLRGIPAILLEVVDKVDPIEVGQEGTYEIRVTNQGTSPGTNIQVSCDLEAAMQHVRTTGPTSGSLRGQTITFAPLASLAPKEQQSWTVVIKAIEEADVRFSVKLLSDQISRPVEETEATNFYR